MRLLDVYNKYLVEANLKNLYTKSVNETPKMASRGQQLKGRVRYFGLSKDGTLNFKIASQSISGRFYYAYIEAPDIIKFSDIIEEGDHFTLADLNRLLTMDGFRVYCSCPAHLYWSFQYMATMGGYEIEPETRAPKRNNVLLQGALDKHLIAVVDNIYNNQSIRDSIVKDIDNYLRMLNGLDYEDYQQLNHARQIQQQNRAVKWKNNPTDYMNDYFARQAKNHQFLDDHDIRHSLKVEGNKFAKANPNATVDDFLRSYFNMTQKAFAEEMKIPESSVEDYFNELGFNKAQEKGLAKQQSNNQNSNKGLDAGILTKDSESIIKESADLSKLSYTPEERQNVINKTKSNMQSHRLSKYIEFVDINYVDAIKEYDRELMPSHSDEGLLKLFNQIKENGITEPLMICFNPYTGDIYLGEGNHRLMFAKLLKLEEVPCYCVRNERFSLGKHSINPDNITPIQDDKDLGRYYADPMKPSMLGEPFGPNYDGHLLKESYVYANEVTNKELNSNPVKFVTYGDERREIEFNNLSDLFKYINQCGGFNSFKGIRWSVMSEYKGSEFYLVRNSYARGGWIWEDVNGSHVSYEPRSFRTKSINESENEKQYLDPQEAHIKYQEYLKGHINNVKDAVKLIIDKCSDNEFIQEEKETLINIAEHHDESKFSEDEYMPYLHHFYPTCPEDENLSEEFEMACRHHILSNKHHWDFWIDPKTLELRDIPDNDRQYKLYCVERVADWLAMAKQHDEDKSIWYEYNRNAIKMPDWAFEFIDYIYSKVPDDFYLNLHFGGTRGPLDESQDLVTLPPDVDRSDVYVHTNRPIKSRFPALGNGYYLFQINSVAPEIHQPAENKNNRYYTISNNANIILFDSINASLDSLPSDLLNELREINSNDISSLSIGELLRSSSNVLGNSISDLMKKYNVDGIQLTGDSNLYSEPITNETIIYNLDILNEINLEGRD